MQEHWTVVDREHLPRDGWGSFALVGSDDPRSTVQARRMLGPFSVYSRHGLLHCDDGYLVRRTDGNLDACPVDLFHQLYRLVEEEHAEHAATDDPA